MPVDPNIIEKTINGEVVKWNVELGGIPIELPADFDKPVQPAPDSATVKATKNKAKEKV